MIDRDLDLGFRALSEGILRPDQLREALAECLRQGDSDLSTILEIRGLASPDQLADLQDRLDPPSGREWTESTSSRANGEGPTAPRLLDTDVSSAGPTTRPWLSTDDPDPRRSADRPAGGGRYRRIELLGTGGLGQVWLAHDLHLGREVALKEVRDDRPGSASMIDRFLEEARITSRLEHRGIVSVYDLVEKDGDRRTPFYTMRLLAGRTLREAIEAYHRRRSEGSASPLEFRGLLDAFTSVCQAVAFAHSRGVLHRDLKGSNVILGDYGEVFVIDWGLAKSSKPGRDPRESSILRLHEENSREDTEPGSILGTPGYIAPELTTGEAADGRSDVYSLGAILYLILAGRPAYVGSGREVIRELGKRDPEPPGAPVEESPRALEAICQKAMARDPSSRYASATELSDEVRRWLADEPVEAYPDPPLRQLARWARKHRSAVIAASVVLISAVVGLSISTALIWAEQQKTAVEKAIAQSEWNRAESNLRLSQQLTVELMTLDYQLSPIPGAERSRSRIFDGNLRNFRGYLRERPTDPSLRKWTAQIARYSANLHRLLNDSNVVEPTYLESISLLESLAAQFPNDGFYRGELALVLDDYADFLLKLGRFDTAYGLIKRSVGVAESLVAESPGRPERLRSLARAYNALATVEAQMGHPAESVEACRKAISIYEGLMKLPASESNAIDPLMMGSCLHALATVEGEQGRVDKALEAAETGIALMRSRLKKSRDDNNASHILGRLLLERGQACWVLVGRRQEAEGNLDEAILIWDDLTIRFASIPHYREAAALSRQIRGGLKGDAKDLEASSKALEKLSSEYPEIPSYRANLGRTYLKQGRLAREGGQAGPARDLLDKAIGLLDEVVKRTPENSRSLDEARKERSLADPPGKP
jgi:eukaryotic-like serine/threonine-protein kinase